MNKPLLTVVIALALSGQAFAVTMSAQDVMTKNEEVRRLTDSIAQATLTTTGGGIERLKGFTWWRKLTGDKVHYDTLTRFLTPAEVRGEGILFLEHAADQNEVMMYLPAFKKIRRVESQQQSSSFMGSEFSYADIGTPHVDDYSYSMKGEEACPAIGGAEKLKCYVIEAIPTNDAVKERTGYSRSVNWIRQDNFIAVKGEYYNQGGELFKRMEGSEIKEVDPANHKWLTHHVKMENVKNGHITLLHFNDVKVNANIPESTFSQTNLAREK